MKTLIAVIIILLILALAYIFILVSPRTSKKNKFSNILFSDYAHRGLHDDIIPENSLLAFRTAMEKGYGIEFDIQLSKDGEVMVFHDYSLKRMTGIDKNVSDLTCKELKQLRLKDSEETIPTFSEVLNLIDGKIPLLIELKGESSDVSLCNPAYEILKDYKGPYCFESFNPFLLRKFGKLLPDKMRGILVTNVLKEKKKYSITNILLTFMITNVMFKPDFIAYDIRYDSLAVNICTKLFSAPSYAWTVRKVSELTKARSNKSFVIFERISPSGN